MAEKQILIQDKFLDNDESSDCSGVADKIPHNKFFYPRSSYIGTKSEKDTRQFEEYEKLLLWSGKEADIKLRLILEDDENNDCSELADKTSQRKLFLAWV